MDGMKTYVGTKIIKAKPMSKFEFMVLSGKDIPVEVKSGAESEEGYLVIYPPDNYKSWSPKAVFDSAYREITDGELELILD